MDSDSSRGLVHLASNYAVPETVARLEAIVRSRGLTILAKIDHSGDAERAGLKMNASELLIFGNPKSGTPLMIASPTSAIDLPLKALAWQDENGQVWLSYNTPEYLAVRHSLPSDLIGNIKGIASLCEEAVE